MSKGSDRVIKMSGSRDLSKYFGKQYTINTLGRECKCIVFKVVFNFYVSIFLLGPAINSHYTGTTC